LVDANLLLNSVAELAAAAGFDKHHAVRTDFHDVVQSRSTSAFLPVTFQMSSYDVRYVVSDRFYLLQQPYRRYIA